MSFDVGRSKLNRVFDQIARLLLMAKQVQHSTFVLHGFRMPRVNCQRLVVARQAVLVTLQVPEGSRHVGVQLDRTRAPFERLLETVDSFLPATEQHQRATEIGMYGVKVWRQRQRAPVVSGRLIITLQPQENVAQIEMDLRQVGIDRDCAHETLRCLVIAS